MFERYTEQARRVVFFARQETSNLGGQMIESEHLLLGVIREGNDLLKRIAPQFPSIKQIRAEITKRRPIGPKVPIAIDLPLSEESAHILAYAAEEADRVNHVNIGTEHLLLAILREPNCLAAEILRAHGFELSVMRESIANMPVRKQVQPEATLPEAGCVPDQETAMKIAEAVWVAVYGEEFVKQQRPLETDLTAGVWTVRGSPPPEQAGQTLVARISQIDGRILKMGTTVFKRDY
jgi:ATP-dependent Clp protease ATP-binding subunit ClpA